jgi:hypothetical protein
MKRPKMAENTDLLATPIRVGGTESILGEVIETEPEMVLRNEISTTPSGAETAEPIQGTALRNLLDEDEEARRRDQY